MCDHHEDIVNSLAGKELNCFEPKLNTQLTIGAYTYMHGELIKFQGHGVKGQGHCVNGGGIHFDGAASRRTCFCLNSEVYWSSKTFVL